MDNIKKVPLGQFDQTFQNLRTFQLIHNELRKDFLQIHEFATEKAKNNILSKPLIRSCYKELFSLIEADIYLLNQFNPYPNFNDRHDFKKKFKETFKQHAKTFNKAKIVKDFNDKVFELLLMQKNKRDNVTHPKGKESIEVTTINLKEVFDLYEKYTFFISCLMTDIYISTEIDLFR